MKRFASFLLIAVLCLAVAAGADERTAKVKTKPLLFVETNSWSVFAGTNQAHSTIAELAREIGFRTDHGFNHQITDQVLEDLSVYLMSYPKMILLNDDKEALRRFIRAGGAFVIVGYDPGVMDMVNYNSFLIDYGIEFYEWEIGDMNGTVPAGCPVSGPRTIKKLITYRRNYFNIIKGNATVIAVSESGKTFGVISKHNNLKKGKVVALGCLRLTYAPAYGGWIDKADNEAFVYNVLNYIYGGYDFSVLLSKFRGKNLSAGDEITAIGKFKNVGTSESEQIKVRFYLSSDGTFPVVPPGDNMTLKTATLAPLQPGKAKKIKIKVKIPQWITPGDYYLLTVADPDGKSSDSNTDNNYKASNKKIVIN